MSYAVSRRLCVLAAAAGLTLLAGGWDDQASAAKHKRPRPSTTMLGAFTTQDWPIVVNVETSRRLITRAEMIINMTCASGESLVAVGADFQAVRVHSDRRFSRTTRLAPLALSGGRTIEYTFQLSGRFNRAGTTVVGTSHDTAIIRDPVRGTTDSCDSGTIAFRAVD